MRLVVAVVVVVLCSAFPAVAQDSDEQTDTPMLDALREIGKLRFQLFNECRPFNFEVGLAGEPEGTGLTRDRLVTLVESRLRGARLYDNSNQVPSLFVSVTFGGGSFGFELTF